MIRDPLSDALGINHSPCDVARAFTGGDRPWALRFHQRQGPTLPVAVRGECWLILDDQEPIRLGKDDLAVPNGTVPFVLASDPAVTPRDADQVFATEPATILPLGGNEVVGIARQAGVAHEELLLGSLPAVTFIQATEAVRYLFDHVVEELSHPGPGSGFAGEQYAQLILVEVFRAALDAQNVPEAGLLRLHADAELRPAVALMHEQPAHPWRLSELAHAVSMSRSAFAARFRVVSGQPPLTYLHQWRIHLAQAALRDTDATLAELAATLGYGSESAFSHAFTRTAGVAPSRYRALHRNGRNPATTGG